LENQIQLFLELVCLTTFSHYDSYERCVGAGEEGPGETEEGGAERVTERWEGTSSLSSETCPRSREVVEELDGGSE